ncbi:hypothetical protein CIHG_00891 [Coccidioides immitis H538.4]|uniref:Uncharacterized protein n=3 Tax=Coccidioides immitis TaxID=5501 RepID=A0A0J8QLC5_COCIT|nr:hypothetical protein CIRG_03308 [Coccidioides immitis RMSCC 2394]KMU73204.1 hypothetical protein CISG_03464 [Coccidioides immitis RMSCC 3703]KMU83109.1 hypothetical protein CIHG_00891 [Coccidioides immitis H538.4]
MAAWPPLGVIGVGKRRHMINPCYEELNAMRLLVKRSSWSLWTPGSNNNCPGLDGGPGTDFKSTVAHDPVLDASDADTGTDGVLGISPSKSMAARVGVISAYLVSTLVREIVTI